MQRRSSCRGISCEAVKWPSGGHSARPDGLVRQVIVESLLLSVGGCISGIAIAGAAVWLIKAIAVLDVPELFQLAARVQFGTSSVLPRLAEVRVGALVLGFAAGVSVFASVICSVGPALQTLLGDRSSLLTGAEPSILPRLTRNTRRLESVFVIAQLAVATMLLVGAGLLVQSLVNLRNVHPGTIQRTSSRFNWSCLLARQ